MQRKPRPNLTPPELVAGRSETLPDEPPKDMDEFRRMLARRIAIIVGNRRRAWRSCSEPSCRRARRCEAPRTRCSNRPPQRPHTAEEIARATALFQRALRAAAAQQEARE